MSLMSLPLLTLIPSSPAVPLTPQLIYPEIRDSEASRIFATWHVLKFPLKALLVGRRGKKVGGTGQRCIEQNKSGEGGQIVNVDAHLWDWAVLESWY